MEFRRITQAEVALLAMLLKRAGIPLSEKLLSELEVAPMDDGGMRSFRFRSESDTQAAYAAAEIKFLDRDDVMVLATLYVGTDKELLEVGIWKSDFSPVIEIPNPITESE